MSGRYEIHTLGCKANAYDADLLTAELMRRGWTEARRGEAADMVIVNSCTVTDEADRQSRKTAARLARRHPAARVVVTGCGAEVAPERYAAIAGVDAVVGNQDKPRLLDLAAGLERPAGIPATAPATVLGGARAYERMRPRHEPGRSWPEPADAFLTPEAVPGRTRAFLKVQEGCGAFCTFCIIPYARGPARSLRPAELVAQVRSVCERGAREVVLTGTALGDYGQDLGPDASLETLVELLLRETPIERLRLGSLDPRECSPRLIELMEADPRVCPHVHISLQSPHEAVLKRMNRRYSAGDVVRTLGALESLGQRLGERRGLSGGVFVGMDVISGFPGESEAVFRWTIERLRELPWHRLHVFPYSEREGTAATRLDEVVPPAVRRERVRELMALSAERLLGHAERVVAAGRPLPVLVERFGQRPVSGGEGLTRVRGYSDNYYKVTLELPAAVARAVANTVVSAQPRSARLDARAGDVSIRAQLVERPELAELAVREGQA